MKRKHLWRNKLPCRGRSLWREILLNQKHDVAYDRFILFTHADPNDVQRRTGVEPGVFKGGGGSMRHAHKMLEFENWNLIENRAQEMLAPSQSFCLFLS